MTTGKVTTITTDWRGDTLAATATPPTTVLQVFSTVDFDEDGGWLVIADSAPLEYLAVDDETNTITLAAAVPATYEDGAPVNVWDPTVDGGGAQVVEYVAAVTLDEEDGGGGAVEAVVPHTLIPLSGVEFLVGATVSLDDGADGDPQVTGVLGREPRLEGGLVAMPIQTAESGKRVVVTSEFNGAVLFYTGNGNEDAAVGAGYITSSATDLGSVVVLQTAMAGPLIAGATSQPTIGLSSQKTDSTYTTYATINAEKLVLNGDRVESPNMYVTAAPTTSGAANCNLGPAGQIRYSTSSVRYKQDLRPADIDPAQVLKLVVQTWRDKAEVDADPDTTTRYIGVTAEDLHDLGLTDFVVYDDGGRPDAVQYDRLFAAVLTVVQDQERRLSALEAAVLDR